MNENIGEIILYQPDNSTRLDVLLREETVWLNRQQIADLFHRDIKTIGKHIHNANTEELKGISTVAKIATVQKEGNRLINREKEYYNLDMILSVGYRVKSQQGIMFRRWANAVLKDYLLRGFAINQRFERLEQRVAKAEEQIGFFVRTALPPAEGVFTLTSFAEWCTGKGTRPKKHPRNDGVFILRQIMVTVYSATFLMHRTPFKSAFGLCWNNPSLQKYWRTALFAVVFVVALSGVQKWLPVRRSS